VNEVLGGLAAVQRCTLHKRRQLVDTAHPGAANSLREGLEEMFTVARLGIDGRLAKTVVTSNPVEYDDQHRPYDEPERHPLARRPDGAAWTAAGMLNAERSFRRIKGYQQMPSSSPRSTGTLTQDGLASSTELS